MIYNLLRSNRSPPTLVAIVKVLRLPNSANETNSADVLYSAPNRQAARLSFSAKKTSLLDANILSLYDVYNTNTCREPRTPYHQKDWWFKNLTLVVHYWIDPPIWSTSTWSTISWFTFILVDDFLDRHSTGRTLPCLASPLEKLVLCLRDLFYLWIKFNLHHLHFIVGKLVS